VFLSLTSLRNGNGIIPLHDCRYAIHLDGRGQLVASQRNVFAHGWVEARGIESRDLIDVNWSDLLDLDSGDAVRDGVDVSCKEIVSET